MTSGADAPAPSDLKPHDAVSIDGREAVFLYLRGQAAIVRFDGENDSRVVPASKLRSRAA